MLKKYVNKLSYLNYSTIYSMHGSRSVALSEYACFSSSLNSGYFLTDASYEVYLIKDPRYALEQHKSNLCFLNERELKKHISLARRLFPFEYSVKSTLYNGYDAFEVKLNLNADHFYHRYILTWLRYAYEFPFNLILNDALRMKHQYLRKESITNLFVLCANSFYDGPDGYNTGHSISVQSSCFLKEQDLKQNIQEYAARKDKWTTVNSLYKRCTKDIPLAKSGEECRYLEYWLDPEDFEKRAKIYLEGYKILKK